jgi:hypothetical protein
VFFLLNSQQPDLKSFYELINWNSVNDSMEKMLWDSTRTRIIWREKGFCNKRKLWDTSIILKYFIIFFYRAQKNARISNYIAYWLFFSYINLFIHIDITTDSFSLRYYFVLNMNLFQWCRAFSYFLCTDCFTATISSQSL